MKDKATSPEKFNLESLEQQAKVKEVAKLVGEDTRKILNEATSPEHQEKPTSEKKLTFCHICGEMVHKGSDHNCSEMIIQNAIKKYLPYSTLNSVGAIYEGIQKAVTECSESIANARISSLESELKALREEMDELFDGDKKNLINLDNEQEAKSKLLKRSLEWMCLPSNEQLLKDRAEIIKEGQSFFKLIDKNKY